MVFPLFGNHCIPIGIQDCVLRGRVSEALRFVRLAYPGILASNKRLLFKLKCRQFVEMIGGSDEIIVDSLVCTSELGSSNEGTPPPRDVPMPSSSRDLSAPLSPRAGKVLDNGEVWLITVG